MEITAGILIEYLAMPLALMISYFFEAIVDFINEQLCADTSRIYIIGFSTSAFLSYGIGCRYPDLIAGIGSDSGGLSHSYLETCRSEAGAVPVQSFHSLDDPTVPFNGTSAWAGQEAVDEMWRQKNGCDGTEAPTVSYKSLTTACQLWNCPDAPVDSRVLKDIDHCCLVADPVGFLCVK